MTFEHCIVLNNVASVHQSFVTTSFLIHLPESLSLRLIIY